MPDSGIELETALRLFLRLLEYQGSHTKNVKTLSLQHSSISLHGVYSCMDEAKNTASNINLDVYLLIRNSDSRSVFLLLIFNDELSLTEQLQLLLFHFRLEALVLDQDFTLQS